ncbi:MAG: NAD-dependent epimerase/dehydratase family protein, partial [Planctomycetota bacterium]
MTAGDVHLVIGAQGNVGGALVERLRGRFVIGAYERRAFDGGYRISLAEVADDPAPARELMARTRPSVVYITAGMTHVDACESQLATAMKINRDGAAALARAARDAGARVVYYST